MKKRLIFIAIMLLVNIMIVQAKPQTMTIHGTVLQQGMPAQEINITAITKDTSYSTTSSENGSYTIDIEGNEGEPTIIIAGRTRTTIPFKHGEKKTDITIPGNEITGLAYYPNITEIEINKSTIATAIAGIMLTITAVFVVKMRDIKKPKKGQTKPSTKR